MTLLSPAWLILIIPLWFLTSRLPMPSVLIHRMRLTALTFLVLAMCGPALRLPTREGTVIVVADRSFSMPAGVDGNLKESVELVHQAIPPNHRLGVVSFGERAIVEHTPSAAKFPGFITQIGRNGSQLGEALERAISLIPREGTGRLMVISDGRATGRDFADAAFRASARGIPIDFRLLQRELAGDLAIQNVEAPPSVGAGEAFFIHAWINSPVTQTVAVELYRDQTLVSRKQIEAEPGLSALTFRDRSEDPGTHRYSLKITGTHPDPVPENNAARLLIGVAGERSLLYLSGAADPGYAQMLIKNKVPIKIVNPDNFSFQLDELADYAGVILENLPADRVGNRGMETLAAWVKNTGAGLMMTGGRNSFGPGGYFRSPLEPILPVSMELRREHRKLAMAMVVILDRSGSMTMPAGGGRNKMDLANLGSVEALELLNNLDEFGCIAVDSSPHTIVPLQQLENKGKVRDLVLRIRSEGGGIFVYEGLKAGYDMIRGAKAGTRHVILFSDANDSEEPGDYGKLLKQMTDEGITVSVIGMGTEKDVDAKLLQDVADKGKGRIFFSDQPDELPRLFAQDTIVAARSTFVESPVSVRADPSLQQLLGRSFEIDRQAGGYNLCYLRDGAQQYIVSGDEYAAPVVTAWQAGIGRSLALTLEANGPYTGPLKDWNDFAEFHSSMARWVAGKGGTLFRDQPVTQTVANGFCQVQIHLDPERRQDPFAAPPRLLTLRSEPGEAPQTEERRFEWADPDTLSLIIPLKGGQTAISTLDAPGGDILTLSPVCLPYSPEFRPTGENEGQMNLEKMARITGGKERLDLAGIWQDLPQTRRYTNISPWLILIALILFLLEVLERRTGLVATIRTPAKLREWVENWRLRRGQSAESEPVPATAGIPSTLSQATAASRNVIGAIRSDAPGQPTAPSVESLSPVGSATGGQTNQPSDPKTPPASKPPAPSQGSLGSAFKRARNEAKKRQD